MDKKKSTPQQQQQQQQQPASNVTGQPIPPTPAPGTEVSVLEEDDEFEEFEDEVWGTSQEEDEHEEQWADDWDDEQVDDDFSNQLRAELLRIQTVQPMKVDK